jgi:hypothetical protein
VARAGGARAHARARPLALNRHGRRATDAGVAAPPAVKAAAFSGRAGSAGPRWASAGPLAGPARAGRSGSGIQARPVPVG